MIFSLRRHCKHLKKLFYYLQTVLGRTFLFQNTKLSNKKSKTPNKITDIKFYCMLFLNIAYLILNIVFLRLQEEEFMSSQHLWASQIVHI